MRGLLRLLSLAVACSLSPALAEPDVRDGLPGHWVGEARFFHAGLHQKTGTLSCDLTIGTDLTVSGTVGAAQLQPARPHRIEAERVDYHLHLQGRLGTDPDLDKDHLVLLVTRSAPGRFDADFHLKSRFGFDWGMRPGHISAAPPAAAGRSPPN